MDFVFSGCPRTNPMLKPRDSSTDQGDTDVDTLIVLMDLMNMKYGERSVKVRE
jgi:hypothetical protein